MNVSYRRVLFIALVTLPLIAITLRVLAGAEVSTARRPPRRPTVEAVPLRRGTVRRWVFVRGHARATRRAQLTFSGTGKVVFVGKDKSGKALQPGSKVYGPGPGRPRGQIIARIDPRPTTALLAAGRAQLKRSRQAALAYRSELGRQRTLRRLAARALRRAETLSGDSVISRQRLEDVQAAVAGAKAAHAAADAKARAAQAEVAAARATVAQARLERERSAIHAPFDGVLAFLNVRRGELAGAALVDASSPERILATVPAVVIDPRHFEIVVELPPEQGKKAEVGQLAVLLGADVAELSSLGEPTRAPRRAIVEAVSPAVDPLTRGIEVRLRVVAGAKTLRDGERVTLALALETRREALLVPNRCLQRRGNKAALLLLDERAEPTEPSPESSPNPRIVTFRLPVRVELEGLRQVALRSSPGAAPLVPGQPVACAGAEGLGLDDRPQEVRIASLRASSTPSPRPSRMRPGRVRP